MNYTSVAISSEDIVTKANRTGAVLDVDGPAVISAIVTLQEMVWFSQGPGFNTVTEQFYTSFPDWSNTSDETTPCRFMVRKITLMDLCFVLMGEQEQYIRGVTEFSGTASHLN